MPRYRHVVSSIAFALILALLSRPTAAATPEQVDDAIKKGVDYIYGQQHADGLWETGENDYTIGGKTAISVYTLLIAGESEKSPKLQKAIKYLERIDSIKGTYTLGFIALTMSELKPAPEVRACVNRTGKLLIEGSQHKGQIGLYRYRVDQDGVDHSNSQYGVLGMWACCEAGFEVADKYWEEVEAAWKADQDPEGWWAYQKHEDEFNKRSINMTAAGAATLFITDDELSFKRGVDCKGNVTDRNIELAIKWIVANRKDSIDPYGWYGIARTAIASGYKYFDDFDWYKTGCDDLLRKQQPDGSWGWNYGSLPGTDYAVLFLCKGRAPILMNKLRYAVDPAAANPVDGKWNQRSRDAAGAAKAVGRQLEGLLNWQVVSLAVDVDDLHDAPILYIAGNEKLKFTPEQEAKIKQFIEDGGMVLGNSDCAAPAFTESFKALFKKMFDGQYEFRALPATHPIFTHQQFPANKWKIKPRLDGLSNGVRELAVLIPVADSSKAWQVQLFKSMQESFELISDIYLYSNDRQQIAHGTTWIVRPDAAAASTPIKVARIQYPGNWNPEPAGWRRLAAVLHNQQKIDLTTTPVTPAAGSLKDYTIAHITGTDKLTLSEEARAELKKFVTDGGTLIIDAAGGSKPFADSAEKELTTIFGADADQLQQPLGETSPIFAAAPAVKFKFRDFARNAEKGAPHGCTIRAITLNNRPAVFFCREDLSAGLVGENVDGIIGYTPDSATQIMSKLVTAATKK